MASIDKERDIKRRQMIIKKKRKKTLHGISRKKNDFKYEDGHSQKNNFGIS